MGDAEPSLSVEPFTIHVPDEVLEDLRARLRNTRWPDPAPGPAWDQGTDLEYLKGVCAYWAEEFDWRAQERKLNAFHNFRASVDGVRIHFVHERARSSDGKPGIPLILTHGWPSTFLELLPLVPYLTDPGARGIEGPAFDLVIPSLPGYGFSERPARANYRDVARLWHGLMRGLGYERYGVGGGDFGAGVATVMALDDPERVIGVHLWTLEIDPYTGEGSRPLSDQERAYLAKRKEWDERERGYSGIQSTKPQTLGYGLHDSPAGLAAWILEKWRSWGDTGGDLESRFSRDWLLTMVTIFWVTGTITSSIRDYFDNRWHGITIGPEDYVSVPTGIANFASQLVFEGRPPREWFERLNNVQRWTDMPRGGHFAPAEEPEALALDVTNVFSDFVT